MKRVFLGFILFIFFMSVDAVSFKFSATISPSAQKYQTACNQFRIGASISETGSYTDYNERAILILKYLEADKDWRPVASSLLDEGATKQQAANAINQKVLYLISQKEFKAALNWIEVQKAFTSDFESVSRNELLLKNVELEIKRSTSTIVSTASYGFPFLLLATKQ